jgi:hypothetical protein
MTDPREPTIEDNTVTPFKRRIPELNPMVIQAGGRRWSFNESNFWRAIRQAQGLPWPVGPFMREVKV